MPILAPMLFGSRQSSSSDSAAVRASSRLACHPMSTSGWCAGAKRSARRWGAEPGASGSATPGSSEGRFRRGTSRCFRARYAGGADDLRHAAVRLARRDLRRPSGGERAWDAACHRSGDRFSINGVTHGRCAPARALSRRAEVTRSPRFERRTSRWSRWIVTTAAAGGLAPSSRKVRLRERQGAWRGWRGLSERSREKASSASAQSELERDGGRHASDARRPPSRDYLRAVSGSSTSHRLLQRRLAPAPAC